MFPVQDRHILICPDEMKVEFPPKITQSSPANNAGLLCNRYGICFLNV